MVRNPLDILGFRPRLAVGTTGAVRLELYPLEGQNLADLLDLLDLNGAATAPVAVPPDAVSMLGSDGVRRTFSLSRDGGCLRISYRGSQTILLATRAFTELPRRLFELWTAWPLCDLPVITVEIGGRVMGKISLSNLRSQAESDRVGRSARLMLQRAVVDQELVWSVHEGARPLPSKGNWAQVAWMATIKVPGR
ncbi:MAG: hypothetical protein C4309_00510 [Chloroflexota bacterium]